MEPVVLFVAGFFVGVTALGIGFAMYSARTGSNEPASVDTTTMLESVDDAVVVLDGGNTVITANDAFYSTFGRDADGQPIGAVLAAYPELAELVEKRKEDVVSLTRDSGTHHIELCYFKDERGDGDIELLLFHDITAHQEHRNELERKNERLDEFASLISHDLRNPLDVAIGRANAVKNLVDDPELEQQLDKVHEAHERMLNIITDVLTLAREGENIGELQDVSVQRIAENAWKTVDTANATLAVTTEIEVRADPARFTRIFENLFRNAVQHGGNDVTVTVGELDGSDGFFVADDGAGIPQAKRDEVLDAGFTADSGGTGLGLAIVTRIAQAHGWTVRTSESASGGAQFEFSGVEVVTDEYATPSK